VACFVLWREISRSAFWDFGNTIWGKANIVQGGRAEVSKRPWTGLALPWLRCKNQDIRSSDFAAKRTGFEKSQTFKCIGVCQQGG
jgi:hypothetical protein